MNEPTLKTTQEDRRHLRISCLGLATMHIPAILFGKLLDDADTAEQLQQENARLKRENGLLRFDLETQKRWLDNYNAEMDRLHKERKTLVVTLAGTMEAVSHSDADGDTHIDVDGKWITCERRYIGTNCALMESWLLDGGQYQNAQEAIEAALSATRQNSKQEKEGNEA